MASPSYDEIKNAVRSRIGASDAEPQTPEQMAVSDSASVSTQESENQQQGPSYDDVRNLVRTRMSGSQTQEDISTQVEPTKTITTKELFPEVPVMLREAVLDPSIDIASAAYNSIGGFLNTLDGIGDLATRFVGAPQFKGLDYIKSKIDELNKSLPETESPAIGKLATNLVVGAPLALAEWEMGGAVGKIAGMGGKAAMATQAGVDTQKLITQFATKYPKFNNVGKVLGSTAVSDAVRMGTLSALAEYGESNNDAQMMQSAASGAVLGAVFPIVGSAIEVMKKQGPAIAEKYMEVLTGKKISAEEIMKADLKTKTPKQIEDIKSEWEAKLFEMRRENQSKKFEYEVNQKANIAQHRMNVKDSTAAVQAEIDALKEGVRSSKKAEELRVASERMAISEERMSSNIEFSLEQPREISEAKDALAQAIEQQNKAIVDETFGFIGGFIKRAKDVIDSAGVAQRKAIESILERNPSAGDLSKNLIGDVNRVLSENKFGGEDLFRIYQSKNKKAPKGSLDLIPGISVTLPTSDISRILTSVNQEGRVGLAKMQGVKDEIDTFVSVLYEKGFTREADVMKKVRDVFDAAKNPRIRDQFSELRSVNETFSKLKGAYDEALPLIATKTPNGYSPNTGSAIDAISGTTKESRKKLIQLQKAEKKLTELGEEGFIKPLSDISLSSKEAVESQLESFKTLRARLRNDRDVKKRELFDSQKKLVESNTSEKARIQSEYESELKSKNEVLARMKREELIASTQFHEKRMRSVKVYGDILEKKYRDAQKQFDDVLDFAQKEKMMRAWRAGGANPNENVIRNIQNILGLGQIFGSIGGLNAPLIATGTGVMAALSPKFGAKISKKLIQFSRRTPKEQNEKLKTIRSLIMLQALKGQ